MRRLPAKGHVSCCEDMRTDGAWDTTTLHPARLSDPGAETWAPHRRAGRGRPRLAKEERGRGGGGYIRRGGHPATPILVAVAAAALLEQGGSTKGTGTEALTRPAALQGDGQGATGPRFPWLARGDLVSGRPRPCCAGMRLGKCRGGGGGQVQTLELRGGRSRDCDSGEVDKKRRPGKRSPKRRSREEKGCDGTKRRGEGVSRIGPDGGGQGQEGLGIESPDDEVPHGGARGAGKGEEEESTGNAELVDWERDDPSKLPTKADLLKMYKKLPEHLQEELESMAGNWAPANETDAPMEDGDGEVGIRLESVWGADGLVGVRVRNVFEGATQEETGGIMKGDWLVSVAGIDCRELNVPEVGETVYEAVREGGRDSVELVLRRGMGGETPEEGGDVYRVVLKKEWFGGGGDTEDSSGSEEEAEAWLKDWVNQ